MIRDIGNNLKAKRTESGLSISDISQKTKIRESFIAAIENNDKSSVPESYYDLFLKKYADFLHIELPEDEEKKKQNDLILELLTEKNGNKKKKNQFVLGIKRILLFIYMHKKTFAALIFLFLFFLFIRYIYIILNTGEKSEKSESMVKIITIEGDPDDKISINIRDSIMIDDDKIEYFFLKISAADSCYICYYSDTLSVKETMLLPGKILAIKAERIIEAKLGKSGAVDLEFNKNKILKELKELINASSIIQVTYKGAERIKRSEKISEYLKNTYGLE